MPAGCGSLSQTPQMHAIESTWLIKYKPATNDYILEFLFHHKKLNVCEDRLECVKNSQESRFLIRSACDLYNSSDLQSEGWNADSSFFRVIARILFPPVKGTPRSLLSPILR